MKKDISKENHEEEEIKIKIQKIEDSTKIGVDINELILQEDKSKSNSINMEISNENISPNIIMNEFILNNSLHVNNINISLSNSSQNKSDSTNFKSDLSIDLNYSNINESTYLHKLNI